MRTSIVAGAICCSVTGLSAAAEANAAVRRLTSIPPQPLEPALQVLAKEHDLQVVYRSDVVGDRRTHGAAGELTTTEAFQQLLRDTGLQIEYIDERTVTIVPAQASSAPTIPSAAVMPSAAVVQDAKRRNHGRMGIGAFFATLAAAFNASGQEAVGPNGPAEIEEIIVTATKRSESIMKVPESITAISADSIANRGLVSADQYLRSVPGVSYSDGGPGQNTVNIRGVVSVPFATGATVGQYLGEVPLTGLSLGSTVDVKLIDMERVEVLRGPQGTLYGSNSLNGTIRSIPNAPNLETFEARVNAEYSSTEGFGGNNGALDGVVNIPLMQDRFAIRAVLYRHENSGFIRNAGGDDPALAASAAFFGASDQIGNEDDLGKSTISGGRIAARWRPTENFDATFTYLRQDDGANDWAVSQASVGRYSRSNYQFAGPLAGGDALETSLDLQNLTMEYRTAWGSLLSSTSFLKQDTLRRWQLGSSLFLVSGFRAPISQDSITHAESLSQELRFASEFSGPFQVIVGAFYEDTEQPTQQVAYYTGNPAAHPFTSGVGTTVGTPRGPQSIYGADIDRATKQIAGFGEISYQLTPELKVTGGMRYYDYDFTLASGVDNFSRNTALAVLPLFVKTAGESGDNFKAAVEYEPLENTMFYAKFSQGFRLGRPKNTSQLALNCDANGDGLIDNTQLSAVDPLIASDSLDSYEVGAKATLFDARLALSAGAYRINWNDIPVSVINPGGCAVSSTFNAGKVTVEGFELEAAGRIAALTVDFGVGNNLSRLANTTSVGPEGAQMNNTPRWNGHVGAEYGWQLFGKETYLRGDYSYYGDFWTGLGRTGRKFDAYGVIDVSARVVLDNLGLRLFANNVTNEDALTTQFTLLPNGVHPLRPRTVGLRLEVSF